MKKSAMLASIVLPAIAAGCATPAQTPAQVDPELTCGPRTVTVFHGAAFLAAYPPHIDVCRGEEITIRVVPPVAAGSARTEPAGKNAEGGGWLRGRTAARGAIALDVPSDADLDVYKYDVTVDGVGTLDPTVRVVR